MAVSRFQCRRVPALFLVVALSTPFAGAQQQQQQSTAPAPGTPGALPSAPWHIPDAGTLQNNRQTTPPPQQTTPPAGVAVAPVIRANGVPASEPSGAAIAPAPQKRRFSVALRVGLIVGAAIAVGSVAAVSLASPGRAHAAP